MPPSAAPIICNKTICLAGLAALQWRMPQLTRKRVNDRPVTWYVHYAGVRVGVIVERSGARHVRQTATSSASSIRRANILIGDAASSRAIDDKSSDGLAGSE